jgi:hypothetical protein
VTMPLGALAAIIVQTFGHFFRPPASLTEQLFDLRSNRDGPG